MEQEVLDAPITSAVGVYNPITAGIALMLKRHGHVLTAPPVVKDDPAAMAAAKASRQELVKFRTTLEKARKAEKAESLAYGRLVDSEAARIQAFADPLELAYDKVILDEEDRLEAIRLAEMEAERQHIAHHRARIQTIKEVRETAAMCRTADRLKQLIDSMPLHLTLPFDEFQGEAETAFNETCTVLEQMHGAKTESEAQAAELKRQQEELARQRTEQAARDLAVSQARIAEEAAAQARLDEMNRRELELQAREREAADREAAQQREARAQEERDAAAKHLAASRPEPLTAQDIAEGVVDAEVKPEMLLLSDMMRCCELAAPLGVEVCPQCIESNSAYQALLGPEPVITLGQISTRFGPGLTLTADFLRSLGFEPAERDKKRPAAVLYRESDFFHIGTALAARVTRVRDQHNV